MSKGPSSLILLGVTTLLLWGLLVLDPFLILRSAFTKTVGAGRDEALVSRLYQDSSTQEVTNGKHPLDSLRQLETEWSGAHDETRFVLMGNSQTLTLLLAPREIGSSGELDRTYPDLLITHLQATGTSVRGYRLSAPNISYMEALWYLHYLLVHPCLIPNQLIIQLNFESFRKTGVREGMLELLRDPAFAAAVDLEARSSAAYAATFQQAIDHYRARILREKGADVGTSEETKTGIIESHGIGGLFETRLRAVLDRSELFRPRSRMKSEFLDALYLARVHVLGITPTTKRSIGGAALTMNVRSLEQIGQLCREHGIRVTFFNAPQNPSAPLYRTAQDRTRYQQIVSDLSCKYASRYFDFENSIPREMWGVWIDGPDPIHFGRAAHHKLADLMFKAGLVTVKH